MVLLIVGVIFALIIYIIKKILKGIRAVLHFLKNFAGDSKKRAATKAILDELIHLHKDEMQKAIFEFQAYSDTKKYKEYFTYSKFEQFKMKYDHIYRKMNASMWRYLQNGTRDTEIVKTFYSIMKDGLRLREDYNNQFVMHELRVHKKFFDNIENRSLDEQQRVAIVTDEDNNLVIAGAGSGKTTTIVGKVNYIIDRYHVNPEEILLISFTRKSADILGSRINVDGVSAKTFHKFSKDVIVEVEKMQPSIFEEAQYKQLIMTYFMELKKDPKYSHKFVNFITQHARIEKTQFDFKDHGSYIQYLKDQNFKPYKDLIKSNDKIVSYKREVVKSVEEWKIANYLFFNGIDYQYEKPYEVDTSGKQHKQYKPDFFVSQKGKSLYIEHFALSRQNKVPHWFNKGNCSSPTEKYLKDMQWKRELHKENGTILIETYSYEMQEGILFENLKNNLKKAGIILKPKTDEEIMKIISETKEDIPNFIQLLATFITLMKSNNYSLADVIQRNKEISQLLVTRNELFIDLVKPFYERYEHYLKDRNEIDFSDMINKAAQYIETKKFKSKFKYIIIDEFQDISIGRYQLLKAIRKANPLCKLFCVGDDWQSIYRFTGSDIALFKNFEEYFGVTVKSKIETTYRFHEPLLGNSSSFILKNPNQSSKELKGIATSKMTSSTIVYTRKDSDDDTEALKHIFDQLISEYSTIENKEILILGRYSFDIDRIKNVNDVFHIEDTTISYTVSMKGRNKKIKAQFLTVHKAKGLEADIIIILNCNAGRYGFPSQMSDDPVLNIVLSEADQYENGEERRLFYVAMTRAKESVFFVANDNYKSPFIIELEDTMGKSHYKKCPFCKKGDIILRNTGESIKGDKYSFYGCSNYVYGCEYTETKWEN